MNLIRIRLTIKQLFKQRVASLLNFSGIFLVFYVLLAVASYIFSEYSFDRYHTNLDRTYALKDHIYNEIWTPAALHDYLESDIPEIDKTCTFSYEAGYLSKNKNEDEQAVFFTGYQTQSSAFDIFSFPFIEHEPDPLGRKNTVVLTQSLSEKLFGNEPALGQALYLDKDEQYIVTGILEDIPKNSTIEAECFLSIANLDSADLLHNWSNWSFHNYVLLKEGTDPMLVSQKIDEIPALQETIAEDKEDYGLEMLFSLLPFNEMHFAGLDADHFKVGNPVMIQIFLFTSLLILILGLVNFINFLVSQLPVMSKSIALSKVSGQKPGGIRSDYRWGVFIYLFSAFIISLLLFGSSAKALFESLGFYVNIAGVAYYSSIVVFLIVCVFVFLSSRISFGRLARTNIIQILHGENRGIIKNSTLKSGTLITTQFLIAIILIVSSLFVFKQIDFWRNYNTGLESENILCINTSTLDNEKRDPFANELMSHSTISDYTYARFIPGEVGTQWGREVDGKQINMYAWGIDDRFFNFFDLEVEEGRHYSRNMESDKGKYIMNRKAVEVFQWDEPLSKKIEGYYGDKEVIGLTPDFNFSSLKEEIEPIVFFLTDENMHRMMLKITPGNLTQTIKHVETTWDKFAGNLPLKTYFLEERLNNLYEEEMNTSRFLTGCTLLAIVVAILGLFSQVIILLQRRTKEIGVRKVSGAKTKEVLLMHTMGFLKYVCLAFILACPLVWLAMNRWLENFAYRTSLSWWIFAFGGMIAIVVALLTVIWQTWKAASRNPVEALRYE